MVLARGAEYCTHQPDNQRCRTTICDARVRRHSLRYVPPLFLAALDNLCFWNEWLLRPRRPTTTRSHSRPFGFGWHELFSVNGGSRGDSIRPDAERRPP